MGLPVLPAQDPGEPALVELLGQPKHHSAEVVLVCPGTLLMRFFEAALEIVVVRTDMNPPISTLSGQLQGTKDGELLAGARRNVPIGFGPSSIVGPGREVFFAVALSTMPIPVT